MRFLIDEDLPAAVADLLRDLGHEAEHVRYLGLCGKPDRRVLAAAQEREAILMSADMGFASIQHYPLGKHSGIVVVRLPDFYRRKEILALIRAFISTVDADLYRALTIVTPGSVRIRR